MKYPPKIIALFQAAALTIYIVIFALLVRWVPQWIHTPPSPVLSIVVFLLAFVISALISGSLILGYPATLFISGNKREAIQIVIWSLAWLIIFLILFLLGLLLFK